MRTVPAGNETGFSEGTRVRARAFSGRLRLTRRGSTLQYVVTDAMSPDYVLRTEEVGDVDVAFLRLFAFSGWGPVAVDVRFTDLLVAADEFPDGFPGPVEWSKATLPALLAGGFLVTAGLGTVVWLRRRRRPDPVPACV